MSKKNEDGINSASSEIGFKTACWMCGVEHTQNKDNMSDTTKHLDWCQNVTRKIYSDFSATFREVYNALELALDGKKLEIAKSLIGNKIMEARNKSIERVINYHTKDGVVRIEKGYEPVVQ